VQLGQLLVGNRYDCGRACPARCNPSCSCDLAQKKMTGLTILAVGFAYMNGSARALRDRSSDGFHSNTISAFELLRCVRRDATRRTREGQLSEFSVTSSTLLLPLPSKASRLIKKRRRNVENFGDGRYVCGGIESRVQFPAAQRIKEDSMRLRSAMLALCLFAGLASNAHASTVVYQNDFNSGSASGFTGFTTVETAPNGQKYIGFMTFGATSTLALSGLAPHTQVTVDFDVYGLLSLDYNSDWFRAYFNGSSFLNDTFGHNGTGGFSGPTGTAGAIDPSGFGYGCYWACAQSFHYSFTFLSSAPSVTFDFVGASDQGWGDEAFGLDNVVVTTDAATSVPEPASISLIAISLAGLGILKRKKN